MILTDIFQSGLSRILLLPSLRPRLNPGERLPCLPAYTVDELFEDYAYSQYTRESCRFLPDVVNPMSMVVLAPSDPPINSAFKKLARRPWESRVKPFTTRSIASRQPRAPL